MNTNTNMGKIVWTEEEISYLLSNYKRVNNRKLAGSITMIHGILRTPKAIADKLNYLKIKRTKNELKKCGMGPGKKCPCCNNPSQSCKCHFKLETKGFMQIGTCQLHKEDVWLNK